MAFKFDLRKLVDKPKTVAHAAADPIAKFQRAIDEQIEYAKKGYAKKQGKRDPRWWTEDRYNPSEVLLEVRYGNRSLTEGKAFRLKKAELESAFSDLRSEAENAKSELHKRIVKAAAEYKSQRTGVKRSRGKPATQATS